MVVKKFDSYDQFSKKSSVSFFVVPIGAWGLLETVNHEINGYNVLIIDRLELLPHYRKKRLGLIILRHLIDRFSLGAAIVAIKPFPLQFEAVRDGNHAKWRDQLALDEFSIEEDRSNEKLRQYYAKLGFNGLGSSPFMVISTATVLPDNWK